MTQQQVATPTKKQITARTAKSATSTAAKKPLTKKPPAKKTAAAKAKPASTEKTKAKPTPEERYRMVETTAYFIAERNGFQGDSIEHWRAAEIEIEIAAGLGQ